MYAMDERIGMADLGTTPAHRALDMIQGSSCNNRDWDAEAEDCAPSEAAARDASLPGTILWTRASGSRDPAHQAVATRDLPLRRGH